MTGRAPVLPPGYRLVALDRVGSTNDEARRLAVAGADDGTLVWALAQTAGRGRQGRAWASPPGNLSCSLILRPDVPLARAAELSFVAALGVGGAVGALVPPRVEMRYKWPNDVLLNDRKVAGILLESSARPDHSIDFVVLGVGINVLSQPEEARFPATSLKAEGAGAEADAAAVLESFARHFRAWVDRWRGEGFAPVRAAWLARAWRLGERLAFAAGGSGGLAALAGRFDGLDGDGSLILAMDDGTSRRFAAGEIGAARPA
ncbi:MAG: biotin--[acetyl-CoA-carboxylase] ligase [Alphaproteobacteria bacterium]|nr:biotin--[acetyl-CoA-carboxylase] ligase [Alphaproteobacteria bacterium]